MSERVLLWVAIAAGFLLLSRRSAGGPAISNIAPIRDATGLPLGTEGELLPVAGGGYRFPLLPQEMYYTSDPATGQVYVVERGSGGVMPWVSTADILRGG